MPDTAYWALPKLSPEEINRDRSKTFGSILRAIDYHAAHLGAGHAAQYERAEFDKAHLGRTFYHLNAIDALVGEAKDQFARLFATQGEKEEQP